MVCCEPDGVGSDHLGAECVTLAVTLDLGGGGDDGMVGTVELENVRTKDQVGLQLLG